MLEKQLVASHKRAEQLQAEVQQKTNELADKTTELTTTRQQYHGTIVRVAQGEALSKEQMDFTSKQRALGQQRAERVVTDVLAGLVTGGQQVQEALRQHGFTLHKTKEEQLLVRETATAVQFPLAAVQPNGQPLHEQIKRAIERTQAQQQQQKRMEVANDPRSLKATITVVDPERENVFGLLSRRLAPASGRYAP